MENTKINYQIGELESKVIKIINLEDNKTAILTDISCFHPEDYLGGDQPGDIGVLVNGGVEYKIVDTQTFILNDNLELQNLNSKREMRESGNFSFVGHIIKDSFPKDLENNNCILRLDMDYRKSLQRVHSGVHLMSICLNKQMDKYFKKDINKDVFKNNDFDYFAISSSTIKPFEAIDIYRFGKSQRKKFDLEKFKTYETFSDDLQNCINQTILDNQENEILISTGNNYVGDFRKWNSKINEIDVIIPCGGTHVSKIKEIGNIEIKTELKEIDGTQNLIIYTKILK